MKTLRASYAVGESLVMVGKSHPIAERLVKPAMLLCAEELLDKEFNKQPTLYRKSLCIIL